MGRKILFITTDQQRYDALGCNGGTIARTPVVDGLAARGVRYERAYNQNTVCMPARSTMLTGQYVRTHGVIANGVPLPEDAPSIAEYLHDVAGYRTALLGKAHFEPGFDFELHWPENYMSERGLVGPYRGFEHAELAMHVPDGRQARAAALRPLADRHARHRGDEGLLAAARGRAGRRDRRARDADQPDPARLVPHRLGRRPHDRVPRLAARRRRLVRVDVVPRSAPPVGPARVGAAPLQLARPRPAARPSRVRTRRSSACSRRSPRTGSRCGTASGSTPRAARARTGRRTSTPRQHPRDQRDVAHHERAHRRGVRPRARRGRRSAGWDDDTDVIFTTDHGELQGDYGLVFKGPFHTDSLMRLPMVWRPAPSAGVAPAVVREPVGQLDLAPTFCEIAGVPAPEWIAGRAAPDRARVRPRARAVRVGLAVPRLRHAPAVDLPRRLAVHGVRAVDGRRAERARRSGSRRPGMFGGGIGPISKVEYDGTEGELYAVDDDPHQFENRWDDPEYKARARRPRRRPLRHAPEGTQRPRSRAPRLTSARTGVRRPSWAALLTPVRSLSLGKRRRLAVWVAIAQRLPSSSQRRAGPVA